MPTDGYTSISASDASTGTIDLKTIRQSSLYNEDLAPIPPQSRSWGMYNYAALWIAMSVNIPT
jgi:cytosine/uracil/thiamine/allantoin permease